MLLEQYYIYPKIIIISEGSCDTEDWRNDADSIQLYHHRNKWHFKIH